MIPTLITALIIVLLIIVLIIRVTQTRIELTTETSDSAETITALVIDLILLIIETKLTEIILVVIDLIVEANVTLDSREEDASFARIIDLVYERIADRYDYVNISARVKYIK